MVSVDAAKLETFLTEHEEMKAQLTRIASVADVGRLANYDSKTKKLGPRLYRVSAYLNPKTDKAQIITSWKTLSNVSFKDTEGGGLHVDQKFELTLEDGSQVLVKGYKEFSDIRYANQVVAEEVSHETDSLNVTTFTLRFSDGKSIKIREDFLN